VKPEIEKPHQSEKGKKTERRKINNRSMKLQRLLQNNTFNVIVVSIPAKQNKDNKNKYSRNLI
jgi:hypothetical protein